MNKSAQSGIQLPLPDDLYGVKYQNGITDPRWPVDPPSNFEPDNIIAALEERVAEGRISEESLNELSPESIKESYDSDYAGRISRQKSVSVLRANCHARSREELQNVLRLLTRFSTDEIKKLPSVKHLRILETIPDSYRVTITLGFGASLFSTLDGVDRFDIANQKPRYLKLMPAFFGDSESLERHSSATDIVVLIASDHPYINVAIVRFFAEYFNLNYHKEYSGGKSKHPVLEFLGVEEGFQRKDTREFLGFDDGIDNISMREEELEELVYVSDADNEPDWCTNGTYLVYRKIRENMPKWESLSVSSQEAMIGREKKTGKPLSREVTGPNGITPVFGDGKDPDDGKLNSHIRKVQPRRNHTDLFNLDDLDRRFLRRPYPFFDGLDQNGNSINGLQFLAFMKSIQQQFEHVVNMWQLNPDFPIEGAGIDALYEQGILETLDGGYYFCPPGLKDGDDYFGSGMF